MNTTKYGMRAIVASAAAGALVLGSAVGVATAKGKPDTVPTPQQGDRLVTVNIKRHTPIDLAPLLAADPSTATLRLRAKLWDPKRDSSDPNVSVTLGVYTKKVGGALFNVGTTQAPVDAPLSEVVPLVMDATDLTRKVKDLSATPLVEGPAPALWTTEELTALANALAPGEKAYICTHAVTVDQGTALSKIVRKRTGMQAKGKAVRDCVKVIDSTPL